MFKAGIIQYSGADIRDYDFITTCNWTSTGTFIYGLLGEGSLNVVGSYTLFITGKKERHKSLVFNY